MATKSFLKSIDVSSFLLLLSKCNIKKNTLEEYHISRQYYDLPSDEITDFFRQTCNKT